MKNNSEYSKFPRTWSRRLLANPDGFSAKIGLSLTEGNYEFLKKVQPLIAQAMAVWHMVNPNSAFYELVQKALYVKAAEKNSSVDWREYESVLQAHVKYLHVNLLPDLIGKGNKYVDALCMFLLLPADVARKWLWHENVDFQSMECLLRRLTKEQFDSLELHYKLVQDKQVSKKDLPCFKDGVLNKVWRFFNPTFKEQSHTATKAAIAYDFLGMGMGFRLYPDVVKDDKIEQELALQFLSKRKRDGGDFEVNKEHGGLYWLLYRLWHSNALYGGGKEVEFGRWVCPGFWFTMIFWGVLALLSPVCLVAGVALYAVYGVTSVALFMVGGILPSVLAAIAVKKVCGKTYNEDYWKLFFGTFITFGVGNAVYHAVTYLKDFPSFHMGLVSMVFLVPYCVEQDTWAFWKAPVMGKLFPFLFLVVLGFDLSQHSMFFEWCWSVVVAIGVFFTWLMTTVFGFLYDERWVILMTVLVLTGYVAGLYGLVRAWKWASEKCDTMIANGDGHVNAFHNKITWFVGTFCGLCGVGGYAGLMYSGAGIISSPMIGGFLTATAAPLLGFLVLFLTVNSVDKKVQGRVTEIALNRIFLDGQYKAILDAIASNSFWTDVAYSARRAKVLDKMFDHLPRTTGSQFDWFLAMVSSVENEDELNNMMKFYMSERRLHWELSFDVTPRLLELIFVGATADTLRQTIDEEKVRLAEVARLRGLSVWQELDEWRKSKLVPFLDYVAELIVGVWTFVVSLFKVASWPLRALWKGVWDLYRIWKAFQEQCPPAPPNERPLAR